MKTKYKEKRKFTRVRIKFPVELMEVKNNEEILKDSFTETVDMSIGGLKIITNYELPKVVKVKVRLTPFYRRILNHKNITLKAKRVRSRALTKIDRYYNALKFFEMHKPNQEALEVIIKHETDKYERAERIPHHNKYDYSTEFVEKRKQWLSKKCGEKFDKITNYDGNPKKYEGNVENFIGTAQVPIGLVGPIVVNGEYANGTFYVPFATTEGALVETYQRGSIALAKSGGVNTFIVDDKNRLDPIFILNSNSEAKYFISWVKNNYEKIKEKAESTTKFGRLVNISPHIIGRRVILDIAYYTSDAMGANMINIATEEICKYISQQAKVERYFLRSNFSSEKKASAVNLLRGYGKEVSVEATIPARIIKRFLFTTPEDIHNGWDSWVLSTVSNGMLGSNAHFANGTAAIFIACGQDVAHVPNVSVGIFSYEITESGALYMSLKLPNIIVGTVGGGTALDTQKECLKMIGCYGKGKARKFSEIIAATLLAGELGLCAGVTTKHFLDPHIRARQHTRKRAFQQDKKT